MKTIKSFAAESHINETIIRRVVRQCGGWASFKEMASDVANHGADGGFHGFIYYQDTVPFARRLRTELIDMAADMDREIEDKGVIAFLASFRYLSGYSQEEVAEGLYNPKGECRTLVYNALAWFALEEVCRSYCDLTE